MLCSSVSISKFLEEIDAKINYYLIYFVVKIWLGFSENLDFRKLLKNVSKVLLDKWRIACSSVTSSETGKQTKKIG